MGVNDWPPTNRRIFPIIVHFTFQKKMFRVEFQAIFFHHICMPQSTGSLNHRFLSFVRLAPSAPILLSCGCSLYLSPTASRYGLQRLAQRLPSDELAPALAAPDRWDAFAAKFGPLEALAMCLMQCCNGGALTQDGTTAAARARFFQACVGVSLTREFIAPNKNSE
jgi:hypothetical protein